MIVWTARTALAIVVALAPVAALRAQGYNVAGIVFERESGPPKFGTPKVQIDLFDPGATQAKEERLITPTLDQDEYKFEEFLGYTGQLNYWRVFFFAAEGDYESELKLVELSPDKAGKTIQVPLEMVRRDRLAEAYRREVKDIQRKDGLTIQDYRRAMAAVTKAVSLSPELDNYLLAIDVSRQALHESGIHDPIFIVSQTDLLAMPGFDELPFDQQWRAESALLDMLASAPNPSAPVSVSDTFTSASVSLADEMLSKIDPADSSRTSLPVTRVFNALNHLHALNGDCSSLVTDSRRAIELAPVLQMNWASQRGFLLEWGDCLERMSGIGDGRSLDAFVAETAARPSLKQMWTIYAAALNAAEDNFLYPSHDNDKRLKVLMETANLIGGI